MKASALHDWLSSQIKVLEKACAGNSASGLRRISDVLAVRKDASVTEVCKGVSKVARCGGEGANVETIAELLSLMVEGACRFAKAADAKDLKRFAASIESKKDERIDAFVLQATKALAAQQTPAPPPAGLSEGDLGAYLNRLEEALGDERSLPSSL